MLARIRAPRGQASRRRPRRRGRAPSSSSGSADEERDARRRCGLAHGLDFEVAADDDVVVPGQTFDRDRARLNQGAGADRRWRRRAARRRRAGRPRGRRRAPRELAPGSARRVRFAVTVPPRRAPSQPVLAAASADTDRYELVDPRARARPWAPARRRRRAALPQRRGGRDRACEPARWRYEWPGGGEKQKVVNVVPALSVRVQPEIAVVPAGARGRRASSASPCANSAQGRRRARVRLEAPAGWKVEPREAALAFRYEGEEVAARFTVTPARRRAGEAALRARVVRRGGPRVRATACRSSPTSTSRSAVSSVPRSARVLALDVAVAPGISVGYVDGAGDEVGPRSGSSASRHVPDRRTTSPSATCSRFTTIVTGIRAYETRADLRSYHHRLMGYVEGGGNLVVQYNRLEFNRPRPPRPRAGPPRRGGQPVRALPGRGDLGRGSPTRTRRRASCVPDTALLTTPQPHRPRGLGRAGCRSAGLNFLAARDPRYENLVALTDPFPLNPGRRRAPWWTRRWAGAWTYVGLGLFRQLPAGVPGAYRLLANLVGRPRGR